MATPTHYIRTINSANANTQWGSRNVFFDLGGLINQYPPGLGHGPQEVPYRSVSRRRHLHSAPLEMHMSPKHSAIHLAEPVPSRPPYTKFDPFADENSIQTTTKPASLPLTSNSSTVSPRVGLPAHDTSWPPSTGSRGNGDRAAVNAAPPRPPNNRDARARLVAGILLNRVHAVGKPMRRPCLPGEPRGYVKSRLSSVVTADA